MPIIHLGCGLDYHPGAVNVDRYDLSAADLQADVLHLPFPAGSVNRIEAHQLVEHLGYAGSLYALAEWWRILAPGGVLLVETPDRPAACLAAAEPDAPAPALHWLFGLALPGYEHRTLFDESELRALAEATGFSGVEITRRNACQLTLRLTACKTRDSLADLRAWLHGSFVAAGIVDPITAPPHLAHLEAICDRVAAAATDLPQDSTNASLAAILGVTARHDARVAEAALQALVALERVPAEAAAPYLNLACSLVKEAFPARLAAYLRQNPSPPGTQAVRLRRLDDQVSLYLTARLHPDEMALQPVRKAFDTATGSLASADREITFFCAESVARLSRRETARGVRAFTRRDMETARTHLESAVAYDADNPLPIWNLARLALVEGHRLEALAHYAALLELVPDAADALHAEIAAVTERQPSALARFLGPVAEEVLP